MKGKFVIKALALVGAVSLVRAVGRRAGRDTGCGNVRARRDAWLAQRRGAVPL